MNRYPDAERAGKEIERLKSENEALRETIRLMSEERGRLEIDLKGLRTHDRRIETDLARSARWNDDR